MQKLPPLAFPPPSTDVLPAAPQWRQANQTLASPPPLQTDADLVGTYWMRARLGAWCAHLKAEATVKKKHHAAHVVSIRLCVCPTRIEKHQTAAAECGCKNLGREKSLYTGIHVCTHEKTTFKRLNTHVGTVRTCVALPSPPPSEEAENAMLKKRRVVRAAVEADIEAEEENEESK
ncbi:hypothetical protein ECG_01357 [Echinococcus granulosus]|nr:hypothetical protein ECG_01357 [Echinococcus granulosus]